MPRSVLIVNWLLDAVRSSYIWHFYQIVCHLTARCNETDKNKTSLFSRANVRKRCRPRSQRACNIFNFIQKILYITDHDRLVILNKANCIFQLLYLMVYL